MLDFGEIREIKRRVQPRLMAIPGVHAVGIGHKLVNGQPTDEMAIMVFLVKKKPISDLAPEEIIPAEIEGVKTDIYESEIPRAFLDDDKYRPLRGGVMITRGGPLVESDESPGSGTLGFIARQEGPVPKIFAVTCHHVVGLSPPGANSNLTIALAPGTITFGGSNTPGTLIVTNLAIIPPGATDPDNFDVFYVTSLTDTPDTIASAVSDRINATNADTASASVDPGSPQVVTITVANGYQLTHFTDKYTSHFKDDSARVQSRITGNQISIAGVAADPAGAFVNINLGGDKPTLGVFAALQEGANPPDNAKAIAKAVTDRFTAGGAITATPAGSLVTITGGQEIECDVFTDLRVGQPSPCFCSICSACCDRRIGRVVNARLDIDAALIQLDPGMTYRAEIAGIDGPIVGTMAVKSLAKVRKRGFMTGLTHGTVSAVERDGYIVHHDNNKPPQWQLYHRHYTEAVTISPPGFAAPGDSGSAVLDENSNNIVGMVFGGGPSGALATPIENITAGFGIVVETSDKANDDRTVPAGDSVANVPLAEIPAFARPLVARIQEARREIVATPGGSALSAAIERHGGEAQRLVNSNRRVATVWHRNGGPQIIQAAILALQSPDRPLVYEFQGKPLSTCLRNMQNIFTRYASAAFAADLGHFGPRLIEFAGMSYNQFLTALQGLGSPE